MKTNYCFDPFCFVIYISLWELCCQLKCLLALLQGKKHIKTQDLPEVWKLFITFVISKCYKVLPSVGPATAKTTLDASESIVAHSNCKEDTMWHFRYFCRAKTSPVFTHDWLGRHKDADCSCYSTGTCLLLIHYFILSVWLTEWLQ